MSYKLQLRIEQHHIATGEPWNPWHCPIANALRERFPSARYIAATPKYITVGPLKFNPSRRAARFMNAFDLQKPVEPSNFEFRLKEEWLGSQWSKEDVENVLREAAKEKVVVGY